MGNILNFIIDNHGIVVNGLGYLTGAIGITIPFLKPSTTIRFGRLIGKVLKHIFRQGDEYGKVKRFAGTAAQITKGIQEGLS